MKEESYTSYEVMITRHFLYILLVMHSSTLIQIQVFTREETRFRQCIQKKRHAPSRTIFTLVMLLNGRIPTHPYPTLRGTSDGCDLFRIRAIICESIFNIQRILILYIANHDTPPYPPPKKKIYIYIIYIL